MMRRPALDLVVISFHGVRSCELILVRTSGLTDEIPLTLAVAVSTSESGMAGVNSLNSSG